MSFPPGPPLPLQGMPPMLPPPYAIPPMGDFFTGMIPMTVGMMPAPMMAPVMPMPAPIPIPHPQKYINKKINPPMYQKYENHVEQELPKGPPVTVFVGNITDRAPDNLVRQILQRCGIVLNWKRVQDANGKLQAFGFCEYSDPDAALRAMRLLHDYELGEKKLVVKVDAKTKEKLDEYKATKLAKTQDEVKENKESDDSNKEEGEASDDALDEMTKQRDNAIVTSPQALISAHSSELNRPNEDKDASSPVSVSTQPEKTHNTEQNSPRPRIDYERLKKNKSMTGPVASSNMGPGGGVGQPSDPMSALKSMAGQGSGTVTIQSQPGQTQMTASLLGSGGTISQMPTPQPQQIQVQSMGSGINPASGPNVVSQSINPQGINPMVMPPRCPSHRETVAQWLTRNVVGIKNDRLVNEFVASSSGITPQAGRTGAQTPGTEVKKSPHQ